MKSWAYRTNTFYIISGASLCLLFMIVMAETGFAQLANEKSGANWQETIRIRGVMSSFDPFNESNNYRMTDQPTETISAQRDNIQLAMVGSDFWSVFRDSLENVIRRGEIEAYTLEDQRPRAPEEQTTVYGKGEQIGYEDLLDQLSQNLTNIDHEGKLIYDLGMGQAVQEQSTIRRLSTAQGRLVNDFELLTMYEVKLHVNVNETGFNLQPLAIIFGTTHWASENDYNEDDLLSGFISGVELNQVGFYLDLTEENTLNYLMHNGLAVSGEQNIMPFYDLITMFHYDYKVFAESGNVLAQGALDFDYSLEQLEQRILNRYNDLTFRKLYGQPPQWWSRGEKGGFSNGMFDPLPGVQGEDQANN